MRIGSWARLMLLMLVAAPFLTGCGDFWQAPGGSGSFTLSNSGNITVAPGATSGNTSTITVTAGSSFSGTVALSCAVTTSPSGVTSPVTCGLSTTSIPTSGNSTLTATSTSSTTTGIYQITVTGTSGSTTETTVVCVDVTTSGTNNCTNTATTSGNFYILNSASIAGYYIKSGTLTALSGSPTALPTGVTPWSMAIAPNGKFLYASTNAGILLYSIGSGGALTQNSSATLTDLTSYALAIDSTGQWLLDASNTATGPVLYAWPINSSTGVSTLSGGANVPGVLIPGSSFGIGGIAISPDNNLVAVAAGTATEVVQFTASSATNPFGSGYKILAGGTAVSVAFDPSSSPKFLYIGETGAFNSPANNSGAIRMFPVSNDVPGTEVSTSPYHSGGTGPHGILAASNDYVYVANWVGTSSGNITAFQVSVSTPSLTLQSNSVSTGSEPYGIAEDHTSSFVFTVNNQGGPTFNAFTFDASTTGQLDSAGTGSTGTGPVAIAAVP